MDKILIVLKYLLWGFVLLFSYKFLTSFIYIFLLIIVTYYFIKSINIKKFGGKKYNILFLSVLSMHLFLLLRALFDPNIVCPEDAILMVEMPEFPETRTLFFYQNIILLVLMYFSLFIYYKIENGITKWTFKNHSGISIIYLILNFISIFFTIYVISNSFSNMHLLYLCFIIIMITLEILFLIKNVKDRKKEWPILLSFILNGVGLLSIILSYFIK